MPFNLGMGELLLVLIVALLVFGGRLPETARSLGKGLTEFKKGLKGVKDLAGDLEIDDGDEEETREELEAPAEDPEAAEPEAEEPEAEEPEDKDQGAEEPEKDAG